MDRAMWADSGARRAAFMIAAGAMIGVGLWFASDRSLASLVLSVVALAGAAATLAIGANRPIAAVTIVFGLASASRFVVEAPVGAMRLEQPAIVALVTVAAWRLRRDRPAVPRIVLVIGGSLIVYVATLAASSILMAPQPTESLRITVWWALSISGGGAAYFLLRGRAREAFDSFAGVAAIFAAAGILAAVVFAIAGPGVAPGIQEADSVQPRVYGLGWESNLYASYLAALFLLALSSIERHRWAGLAALVLIGFAFPLGSTRGAYLGLAAGMICAVAVVAWRHRKTLDRTLARFGPPLVGGSVAIVFGIAALGLLLPNNDQRLGPAVGNAVTSPSPAATVASPGISSAGPAGSTPPVAASPTPQPRPSLAPPADTFAFRMARIQPALDDIAHSLIIGLGANSFGQRHADPSQGGAPDYLGFLALATLYDGGIVNLLALTLVLAILLVGLWQSSRSRGSVLPAAAALGAIVCLLVAYEATNALHFAINWLLFGAALALITERHPIDASARVADAPRGP